MDIFCIETTNTEAYLRLFRNKYMTLLLISEKISNKISHKSVV